MNAKARENETAADRVERRIKTRTSANGLLELIRDELRQHDDFYRDIVLAGLRKMLPPEEKVQPKPSIRAGTVRLSGIAGADVDVDADAVAAIEQARSIVDAAAELPDAGLEFGESVSEKCREIAENIETHGRVTSGQQEALDNMQEGVAKWFR